MITKICKQCGKKFDVPEYRKDAKYCCDECKHKALHGDLNCECEVCGKKFHLNHTLSKRVNITHVVASVQINLKVHYIKVKEIINMV